MGPGRVGQRRLGPFLRRMSAAGGQTDCVRVALPRRALAGRGWHRHLLARSVGIARVRAGGVGGIGWWEKAHFAMKTAVWTEPSAR